MALSQDTIWPGDCLVDRTEYALHSLRLRVRSESRYSNSELSLGAEPNSEGANGWRTPDPAGEPHSMPLPGPVAVMVGFVVDVVSGPVGPLPSVALKMVATSD